MGFDIGEEIDGIVGIQTSSAVILMQHYMTIPVTGIIDESFMKNLENFQALNVTCSDVMWYFNNSWEPEKATIDRSNSKINGNIDTATMTRLLTADEGKYAYVDRSFAVSWAVMIQDAVEYNTNANETDKLDLNCFLPKGSNSGYRAYHEQVEAWVIYKKWGKPNASRPIFDNETAFNKWFNENKGNITTKDWNHVPDELTATGGILAGYGTSNHGWGLAIDFNMRDSMAGVATSAELKWLEKNASKYGFTGYINTDEPTKNGKPNYKETWHWNYSVK
jgi:hypothetical protein